MIHRQPSRVAGRSAGAGARLEKGAGNAWGRQNARKGAVRIQSRAGHQPGFGPCVYLVEGLDACLDIKVPGALLVCELKLVAAAADVATTACDVEAVGCRRNKTGERRAADV